MDVAMGYRLSAVTDGEPLRGASFSIFKEPLSFGELGSMSSRKSAERNAA
jgi:hypothetical protein